MVNKIRKILKKNKIHDSWNTIKRNAESYKQTVTLLKCDKNPDKAVEVTRFFGTNEKVKEYFKALELEKALFKPRFRFVPIINWEEQKAVNF